MALSRKRKMQERDDLQSQIYAPASVVPLQQLSRRSKNLRTSAPRVSPLMALPGELRNEIYELVLLSGTDMHLHCYSRKRKTRTRDPTPCQREPALLQVCKQIRHEAMPIHYLGHIFHVRTRSDEFNEPYRWLSRLSKQLDGRWPRFTLTVVGPHWQDVTSWLPLAKLAHEASFVSEQSMEGVSMMPVASRSFWNPIAKRAIGSTAQDTTWTSVFCTRGSQLQTAFESLVALGATAKQEEWSSSKLARSFKLWASGKSKGWI